MRFFRRLVGLLGFGKDDGHDTKDEDDGANRSNSSADDVRRNRMNVDPIPGPRKGFSVPVQVAVERPVGPILVPCNGDGGVQILNAGHGMRKNSIMMASNILFKPSIVDLRYYITSRKCLYLCFRMPIRTCGVQLMLFLKVDSFMLLWLNCCVYCRTQGLRWYAKRLRIDEDGDVADEFLHEVLPETSAVAQDEQKLFPRFQVKSNTRHAKVKRQVLTPDGKFQQSVECQGRLLWV
ncbi:hypothetical protein Cgig2_024316 [Carnegiea gigantea]|uniref:Uncharacterized protein n=1 Tax=Carnegiea gigantea TaxID=171969 RepID=A0A9Q1QB90_9CARY|nr:hypothetical protein Cgig2_024316 [Carnegiea gigantea]